MGRTEKRKRVNRALKKVQEFYQGGIPFCESCKTTSSTNAHSRKGFDPKTQERWLPTEDDHPNNWLWFDVAWLCIPCHQKVEQMSHKQMFSEIHRLMRPRTGRMMFNLAKNRGWWKDETI